MGEVEVYQAEAASVANMDHEIFSDPDKVVQNQNLTVMEGQAILDPDSVKAEDTEENRAVLDRVRVRMSQIEENYWFLCTDLYNVRENHLYELENHVTFTDYAESQCGIKKRMAHYYCRIHEFFQVDLAKTMADQPELYREILELAPQLGLTRCIKITHSKNVTTENLLPFMKSITNANGKLKTVRDVEEMLSDLGGGLLASPEGDQEDVENPTADKPVRFNVTLEESQAKHVEEALDIASKLSNNKKKSINIANICSEFVSTHSASGNRKKDLKKHLSRQEEFLGLTLIGLDNEENKVLYGPKQLQHLLEKFESCLGVSLVALNLEKEEIVFGEENLTRFSSAPEPS